MSSNKLIAKQTQLTQINKQLKKEHLKYSLLGVANVFLIIILVYSLLALSLRISPKVTLLLTLKKILLEQILLIFTVPPAISFVAIYGKLTPQIRDNNQNLKIISKCLQKRAKQQNL